MTTNHKLVIAIPAGATLDPEGRTITVPPEVAREWAKSVLDVTGPGKVYRSMRTVQQPAGHAPLEVDEITAKYSGLFHKR